MQTASPAGGAVGKTVELTIGRQGGGMDTAGPRSRVKE